MTIKRYNTIKKGKDINKILKVWEKNCWKL